MVRRSVQWAYAARGVDAWAHPLPEASAPADMAAANAHGQAPPYPKIMEVYRPFRHSSAP
jgi:hypothetical protein